MIMKLVGFCFVYFALHFNSAAFGQVDGPDSCSLFQWSTDGDQTYGSSGDLKLSNDEARATCNACQGATLISVHSDDQLQFVRALQTSNGKYKEFWLGVRYNSASNTFNWQDQTPMDFQAWRKGEPNDYSNEGTEGAHCAVVNQVGKWRDIACDAKKRFICQKGSANGLNIVAPPSVDAVQEEVTPVSANQAYNYELPDYRRTVLMMKVDTIYGENIYFRGGLSENATEGRECPEEDAATSACAIPIVVFNQQTSASDQYNAFAQGDNYLDWYGMEPTQAQWQDGQSSYGPVGSLGLWTTNKKDDSRKYDFNTFGDNVWILDMYMDCSKTQDGYFEFKGIKAYNKNEKHDWEWNVEGQDDNCPFDSNNHVAKCGAVNKYLWGSKMCVFEDLNDFGNVQHIG